MRERYEVVQDGSINFLHIKYGNVVTMNVSTLDYYIPNVTFVSHLWKTTFSCQEHRKPLCQYRGTGIVVFYALGKST